MLKLSYLLFRSIFKSKLRKSQLINHAAREKADASKELRLSFIINPILYISPDGAPAKKEPQEQGYSNSSFELPTSTVELTNRTLRVHAPTDTEKRSAQKGIRAYLSGYSYYTKRDKRSRLNRQRNFKGLLNFKDPIAAAFRKKGISGLSRARFIVRIGPCACSANWNIINIRNKNNKTHMKIINILYFG